MKIGDNNTQYIWNNKSMTVRELIDQLKRLDQDSNIWLLTDVGSEEPNVDVITPESWGAASKLNDGDYFFDGRT